MHPVFDSSVALQQQEKAVRGRLLVWDDARVSLQAIRCGRSRAAAARLDLSAHMVRRHRVAFERHVATFMRGGRGLTGLGDAAIRLAQPAATDRKPIRFGRMHRMLLASRQPIASYLFSSRPFPRVRHRVDCLLKASNPAKFQWFKDEFVHPTGFKAVYMGKPLTHLFGGFLDEGR